MPSESEDIRGLLAPFLVAGLAGTALTPGEREILSRTPPAGLILFGRNVEDIEQLRRLTFEIGTLVEAASGLPPLLMADHEGGRISVLAPALGAPPSQMAAWKPRRVDLLRRIVARTAASMRDAGLNLTLSPVADIDSEPLNPVIGTRAFGDDPRGVAEAVAESVRTIAGQGILSCLKHFPGHGSTKLDSHLTLPVTGHPVEYPGSEELLPFAAGIEAGADSVMTAHISALEGDPPASLDRRIVEGILRDKMGFTGLVITDALEMAGALPDGRAMASIDPASAAGKEATAVPAAVAARAIEAGNDLLLMSRSLEEVFAELDLCSNDLAEALSTPVAARMMRDSAARIAAARKRAASRGGDSAPRTGGDAALRRALAERDLVELLLPLEGSGLGGGVPDFLGTRVDFESGVVRRFISRLLGGLPERYLPDAREPAGPLPVLPVGEPDGREPGLYIFEPAGERGERRVLVLLCRKPPSPRAVGGLARGYAGVVLAERPRDAALIPEGVDVMVTYGTYDAAADRLAAILGSGRD